MEIVEKQITKSKGLKIFKVYEDKGTVCVEWNGETQDIAVLLAHAMVHNPEVAALITSTIPTFLDYHKISRKEYCDLIMNGKGYKPC